MLDDYLQYLNETADRFPPGVREFALANWHFDFKHHQCPHDSWLEKIVITEIASGERRQVRASEISATFFGAYHDGYFDLVYKGVSSYSLEFSGAHGRRGHGDWIVDEMTINDKGTVHHEIKFSEAMFSIDCVDFKYHWIPNIGRG